MNAEILAQADAHVQEEWWKLRDRNGTVDRALQIASEAIAAALRGEKVALVGKPLPDAPATDWHAYFVQEAAKRLEVERAA
jgi:hypothetical protein